MTRGLILLYAVVISLVLGASCLIEGSGAQAAGSRIGALACLGVDLLLVWGFATMAIQLNLVATPRPMAPSLPCTHQGADPCRST